MLGFLSLFSYYLLWDLLKEQYIFLRMGYLVMVIGVYTRGDA